MSVPYLKITIGILSPRTQNPNSQVGHTLSNIICLICSKQPHQAVLPASHLPHPRFLSYTEVFTICMTYTLVHIVPSKKCPSPPTSSGNFSHVFEI